MSVFAHFFSLVSFLLGLVAWVWLLVWLDHRLRLRGKNILWLILFFGPFCVVLFAISLIPVDRQKLILLGVIFGGIISAPTAIWGLVEITAASKSSGVKSNSEKDS
ncbi:hypothetical protein [Brevundimonas sanguinis]|uniref:hypothetical protein n=1 Tax=Brevundimonas sanguinis TaxID=3021811 RepID=UPI0024170D9E|nr:hypothetical protein [Brevundimonas sp. NCCP 15609]